MSARRTVEELGGPCELAPMGLTRYMLWLGAGKGSSWLTSGRNLYMHADIFSAYDSVRFRVRFMSHFAAPVSRQKA